MLKFSSNEDNGMTVRLSSIYIKNPPLVQGIKSLTFCFRQIDSVERIDDTENNKKLVSTSAECVLLMLEKHRITQHQLSIFPKTAEHDIISKVNNTSTAQILNTNEQSIF